MSDTVIFQVSEHYLSWYHVLFFLLQFLLTFHYNLHNQQDTYHQWLNTQNWCWVLSVDGIVKHNGFLVNFWLTELFGTSVADTAAFIISGNVYSKSPSSCTIKYTPQSDCILINLPVLDVWLGNMHNKNEANMANHDGTMENVMIILLHV